MKFLCCFILMFIGALTKGQVKQTDSLSFIDSYGATIKIGSNIQLIKPVDKKFIELNINSKIIDANRDSLTQYVIQKLTKISADTYEVKIIYLYHNSELRGIGHRNTIYKLVIAKVGSKVVLSKFEYEGMEF